MKIANYLDVSLNLKNSNYKPYQKPDKEILYIHKVQIIQPACLNNSPHQSSSKIQL